MFLFLIEWCFLFLVILFVFTQIIFPLYNGKIILPLFRSKLEKAKNKKAYIFDELEANKIFDELNNLKNERKDDE
jgi:ABC-type bacteriocin/lantibiotic exporter with double-glycine peptidase domain